MQHINDDDHDDDFEKNDAKIRKEIYLLRSISPFGEQNYGAVVWIRSSKELNGSSFNTFVFVYLLASLKNEYLISL